MMDTSIFETLGLGSLAKDKGPSTDPAQFPGRESPECSSTEIETGSPPDFRPLPRILSGLELRMVSKKITADAKELQLNKLRKMYPRWCKELLDGMFCSLLCL